MVKKKSKHKAKKNNKTKGGNPEKHPICNISKAILIGLLIIGTVFIIFSLYGKPKQPNYKYPSEFNYHDYIITYAYELDPHTLITKYNTVNDAATEYDIYEINSDNIVAAQIKDLKDKNTSFVYDVEKKSMTIPVSSMIEGIMVLPVSNNPDDIYKWCKNEGYCMVTNDIKEINPEVTIDESNPTDPLEVI